MRHSNRRTAPGVRNGRVQKKNRWEKTPNYMTSAMPSLVVDRRRPGIGYRHVVRIPDVWRFVELIPDWDKLRIGLDAIVLDSGGDGRMGWCGQGVVAVCAWEEDLEWTECRDEFFEAHAAIFEKLAIPVEVTESGGRVLRFTEESARAFLLIHVLVHELGHHHDRMTTKTKRWCGRGESFAESFAREHEDEIIARYQKAFTY
jgi:hypothetical protein